MESVDTARGQGAPGASWVGSILRAAPQGGSWKGPWEPGGGTVLLSGPCPRSANSEIKPSHLLGELFPGTAGQGPGRHHRAEATADPLPSPKAEGAQVAGGAGECGPWCPGRRETPRGLERRLVRDDSAAQGSDLTAGRREGSAKFPLTPQTCRGGQGAPTPGPEASGKPGSQGAGGTPTSFTSPFLCGPPQCASASGWGPSGKGDPWLRGVFRSQTKGVCLSGRTWRPICSLRAPDTPTRPRHSRSPADAGLAVPVPAVRQPSPGFGASRRLCCGPAGPRAGSLHRGRAPPSAPSPPALRALERRGRPRSRDPAGARSPNAPQRPRATRLLPQTFASPPAFSRENCAASRLGGTDPPPLPGTRAPAGSRHPPRAGRCARPGCPPAPAAAPAWTARPEARPGGGLRSWRNSAAAVAGRGGAGRARCGQGHPSWRVPTRAAPPTRPPWPPDSRGRRGGAAAAAARGALPSSSSSSSPAPLRLPPSASPPSPHPARSLCCSSSELGARGGRAARSRQPSAQAHRRSAQLPPPLVSPPPPPPPRVEGAQHGRAGLAAPRLPGAPGAPGRRAPLRRAGGRGALGAADPALRVSAAPAPGEGTRDPLSSSLGAGRCGRRVLLASASPLAPALPPGAERAARPGWDPPAPTPGLASGTWRGSPRVTAPTLKPVY